MHFCCFPVFVQRVCICICICICINNRDVLNQNGHKRCAINYKLDQIYHSQKMKMNHTLWNILKNWNYTAILIAWSNCLNLFSIQSITSFVHIHIDNAPLLSWYLMINHDVAIVHIVLTNDNVAGMFQTSSVSFTSNGELAESCKYLVSPQTMS